MKYNQQLVLICIFHSPFIGVHLAVIERRGGGKPLPVQNLKPLVTPLESVHKRFYTIVLFPTNRL